MLTILLIYFIGRRFYDLADKYGQNKWSYAILGVIIYYAVGISAVVLIALLDIYFFSWGFEWESRFGMNLLALPIGLLAVWGVYTFLESRWKKQVIEVKDEINDIGKPQDLEG